MPALFFPTPDALRLVLVSGVVPPAVADSPARAWADDHGRLGVELPAPLPREALTALTRLGVHLLPEPPPSTTTVRCWAALLPLRPSAADVTGPVLFELPAGRLAAFTADLRRRSAGRLSVRLATDPGAADRAWVLSTAPPPGVLLRCIEPDGGVDVFAERHPGVWVRVGWEHPLPDRVVVPAGAALLLQPPGGVHTIPRPSPHADHDDLRLPRRPGGPPVPGPAVTVPVRLRLVAAAEARTETLWVLGDGDAGAFWELCRSADERLLRRLEAARVGAGDAARVVVRVASGRRPVPLAVSGTGFAPDPRVKGLFVPAGRAIKPVIRANVLARLFDVTADRVTWLEPGPDGLPVPHAVPGAAFRPVPTLVAYTCSDTLALDADTATDPFPLPPFGLVDDQPAGPEVAEETAPLPATPSGPKPPARESWLTRIAERLRKVVGVTPQAAAGAEEVPEPPEEAEHETAPAPRAEPEGRRVGSADELLHGPDRAARRRELEIRLLDELPRLAPDRRAARWAELAGVYAATASPDDAAVCWANAVWEADPPPAAWLDQWFQAEFRAARRTRPAFDLDRLLGEPTRPGAGRVVAAFAARAAAQSPPDPALVSALPRVVALLEQHFDDLPVRAAWLARLAVARVSAGDALGLARWHDRVLDRLREKGPGLDLDEPSFLRFHGTATPDRFRTAREWLVRSKGPILKWVAELGSGGRLQWAGLDAETEATEQYAQLLLAWGLGCLGERTRALEWATRARKVLGRLTGPGIDRGVHALLADLFTHRVRDALDGRPAKPGLPDDLRDRLEKLSWFSRFAVDRLRDHSRVLDPADRVRAFRGLDLRELRGHDQLGERLHLLADRSDPAVVLDEARQLLALAAAGPTSVTLPRVTLTLLELAPHLDEPAVAALLGYAVPALDWLDAWLQAGKWSPPERAELLPRYAARLLEAALDAAARFNQLTAVRPLVEYATREAAGGNRAVRDAVELAAGGIFRSLRKLGFRGEAETLLGHLDPARGAVPEGPLSPARVGLAVGWLAVGDEDAGIRLLDAARDRLFLDDAADDRARTDLAVAYAGALGFAAPRVALGRLEELFQRLKRVSVTGSTNRYYTLKPLELIDVVVRSVVTDDFALGPAVRGWLDDDEFLIRRRVHRDLVAVLREQGVR